MIRFRKNPDNPTNPVVEATAKDIDQLRPMVRAFLRRAFSKLGADDIEDITQYVLFVACQAAARSAIFGRPSSTPEAALRAWLFEAAWRSAMSAKRGMQKFVAIIEVRAEYSDDDIDPRSLPDAVVDARRVLELIAQKKLGRGLRVLLLLAYGATYREVAREMGITPGALLHRVKKERRRLAELTDPGRFNEQPQPRSPRRRKRRR